MIDSTAALRYDLSCLSDLFSGIGVSILSSARRSDRPATLFLSIQTEVEEKRLSGKYFGAFLARCAMILMKLANVEVEAELDLK